MIPKLSRPRPPFVLLICTLTAASACVAPRGQGAPSRTTSSEPEAKAARSTSQESPESKAEADLGAARPKGRLTIPEARTYMLRLINRDRESVGLPPVALDDGAATRSGQAHAEDMAHLGYLGHWGSDGSVPEQRYTEAGGADLVLENALCFTDEKVRVLDHDARIDPEAVERAEAMFFNEVPPNDGHRKNILKPTHTLVGIGVAQPKATPTELPSPCFTHEFVDRYGTYRPLPERASVGASVRVEGTLVAGAKPLGVGVSRVASPKPIAPSELNRRRSYPIPKPYQMYWKAGFVTPKVVTVDGQRFSIDVPLSERAQPGLYALSVWAKLDGADEPTMVSLRTVRVP